MNSTKFELKKMNQKETILHHIINEINEVKCHFKENKDGF